MDSVQFSRLAPEHTAGIADDVALSRIPKQYRPIVVEASKQYGIPVHMISNVMKLESDGDPYATSSAGASGLMQLMPSTFKSLGGQGDPYEASQNINLGAKYLSQLMHKYGNEDSALAAYDWGPGHLAKEGVMNAPTETKQYLSKYHKLMGDDSTSNGEGLAALLMKKDGNLPTQIVNANQPRRDSSVGANNPLLQQPMSSNITQKDFPRQAILEAQNDNDDSLESILGVNKLF